MGTTHWKIAIAMLACSAMASFAQTYALSTTSNWGTLQWGGLVFANNRWNNVAGGMYLDTNTTGAAGKDVHWWTTFNLPNNCCSAPFVSLGESGVNGIAADNGFLPVRVRDIVQMHGYWKFKVPMPLKPGWGGSDPTNQQYHVYYQIYLSSGPDLVPSGRGQGDGAWVMYDSYFYRQNKAAGADSVIGTQTYDTKAATASTYGPFYLAVRHDLTPDANGVIEVKDVDLKALFDHGVANGYWQDSSYVIHVSTSYEVMNLTGNVKIETLDLGYKLQKAGGAVQYVPAWKAGLWGTTANIGTAPLQHMPVAAKPSLLFDGHHVHIATKDGSVDVRGNSDSP